MLAFLEMNSVLQRYLLMAGVMCALLLNSCTTRPLLPLDQWEYILVDSHRSPNELVPGWAWFGMDFADANGDGYGDILAGKDLYLNPGSDSLSAWVKSTLEDTVDGMFIMNVDNDGLADIIALKCNKQYWFEALDAHCSEWNQVLIGTESICNHRMSSMGYCKADIFIGGNEELLFTDNPGKIWCFEIPEDPANLWPVTVISEGGGSAKFITVADINLDGQNDIVSAYSLSEDKLYNGICWFENPGNKKPDWKRHRVGEVEYTADHLAAADFNNDGICEILVTEGRSPEKYPASIYLFSSPAHHPSGHDWTKEKITTQFSTNSLSVADMDQDGDLDFVSAEHKGTCHLQIWENDGAANFICHIIDSAKESHNGALLFDIEGDGDLDIASSGWYDPQNIHLWRNKAIQ